MKSYRIPAIYGIDLLIKIGYSGSRKDSGEAKGKSGYQETKDIKNSECHPATGARTTWPQRCRWHSSSTLPKMLENMIHIYSAHKGNTATL